MSFRIPCEIIKDLMPLYVDELTSETTNDEIKNHLEACETCKSYFERMKEEIQKEAKIDLEMAEKEINYLKKIQKSANQKILIGIISVLILLGGGIGIKAFILGYPIEAYDLRYLNIANNKINVSGIFEDKGNVYKNYEIKTMGSGDKKMIIYGKKSWKKDQVSAFNIQIELDEAFPALDINGNTIKADGFIISKLANELYELKNPYLGNPSANAKIAEALGIYKEFGNFTNALQTQTEPYGWTLKFEKPVKDEDEFNKKMKNYAYMLMAVIGNLGEVRWDYKLETSQGILDKEGIRYQRQWGGGEYSIKEYAESPESLQYLLNTLGIRN